MYVDDPLSGDGVCVDCVSCLWSVGCLLSGCSVFLVFVVVCVDGCVVWCGVCMCVCVFVVVVVWLCVVQYKECACLCKGVVLVCVFGVGVHGVCVSVVV